MTFVSDSTITRTLSRDTKYQPKVASTTCTYSGDEHRTQNTHSSTGYRSPVAQSDSIGDGWSYTE